MSMAPTINAYRHVWQTRDLQAWEDALADDVVLHSPVILSPFRGKEAAVELFDVLLETVAEFDISQEFTGPQEQVFFWSARVRGRAIQGCDRITTDEAGRISDITVLIRPLVSVAEFAAAIGPPLATRHGPLRGVLVRALIAPLRVFLAVADAASTRLVQRG